MLVVLFLTFISLAHSQSDSSCALYNGAFSDCSKTIFQDNGEECCWCPNNSLCVSKSHAELEVNCVDPVCFPTKETTSSPTKKPTAEPTKKPTNRPTAKPTKKPTKGPTVEPTKKPTNRPTVEPTKKPTKKPTAEPTKKPTNRPTTEPTKKPTNRPTVEPTKKPTNRPTVEPTKKPTNRPTVEPSKKPTNKPTAEPTKKPRPTSPTYKYPTLPTARRTICFCEPKHKRRVRRRLGSSSSSRKNRHSSSDSSSRSRPRVWPTPRPIWPPTPSPTWIIRRQPRPTPRPTWPTRRPTWPTTTTPVETTCACKLVTGISKPECQKDCVKYAQNINKRDCTWNYFKLTTIEYCNWVAHHATNSDWRFNVKIDKNQAQNSSNLDTNSNKNINLLYILIPFVISSVLALLLFSYCSCKTNKKVVDDNYNDQLLDNEQLEQPAI